MKAFEWVIPLIDQFQYFQTKISLKNIDVSKSKVISLFKLF